MLLTMLRKCKLVAREEEEALTYQRHTRKMHFCNRRVAPNFPLQELFGHRIPQELRQRSHHNPDCFTLGAAVVGP